MLIMKGGRFFAVATIGATLAHVVPHHTESDCGHCAAAPKDYDVPNDHAPHQDHGPVFVRVVAVSAMSS